MNKLMNVKPVLLSFGIMLMLGLVSILPIRGIAQSGVVGSLGGEMCVSPTGIASYSISIEVAPGTCGVQPSLAITYNSASGRGLLGMGWDLTGLSSITRTQRDNYLDGAVGSVNFDGNDRFSLDGARLIKLSNGNYIAQNAVYGTEIENFTRVTLKGTPNDTSQYFVAVTDQGQVIEYGHTRKSKLRLPQGGVLLWMVNKVTDADGNYMKYYYDRVDSIGELKLTRISYTGNTAAGLSEYAHVLFDYAPGTYCNNTYIGGNTITTSNLLEKIVIRYGSDTIRQYSFEYDFDRSIRLTAVVLQDANGHELTRTSINWGSDLNTADHVTINNISNCGKYVFDYNGDNIPDLLLIHYDNSYNCLWEIRKGDNSGSYLTTGYSGNIGTSYPVFTIDYDGDGRDGFGYVHHEDNSDDYTFVVRDMVGTSLVEKFSRTLQSGQFLTGDFRGRGGSQFVFIGKTSNQQKLVTNSINNTSFFIPSNSILSVTDLNGNGKADIQVVRGNYIDVYEFDEQQAAFAKILDSNWLPNNPAQGFHGDFNGDGMMDYVYFTNANNTGHWYLKMSKGNDYRNPIAVPFNTTILDAAPKFPLKISDINGDGKDDIIQPSYTGNGPLKLNVYYVRGFSYASGLLYDTIQIYNHGISDLFIADYQFADFNHDGKNELFSSGYVFQNPVVVNFPERREHDLVASVTNGFGMTTSLEYRYCNSPMFYLVGIEGKRIHYPLVSEMEQPNGLGSVNATTFSYGNAVFDDERHQFLGFGYHKTYCNGTNTKSLFQLDENHHHLYLEQALTYYQINNENGGYVTDSLYWNPNSYPLFHYETLNTIDYRDLSYERFVPYYQVTSSVNRLENTKTTVNTTLDSDGRASKVSTSVYKIKGSGPWISCDSTQYSYVTVSLANGKTAVKPSRVVTWHKRNGYNQTPCDTVSYTYLPYTGRIDEISVSDSDGFVGSTTYTYNDFGLPETETYKPNDLVSRTKTFGYDRKGRFTIEETDVLGHTRFADYDRLTGLLTAETDPNNLTTRYQYDDFGRLTRITRPDQTVRNISYSWNNINDFGNAVFFTRETEAGIPESRTYYDVLGRAIHTYRAGQGYNDIVYDARGRIDKKTYAPYDSPGTSTETKVWHDFTYDNYNRVTDEVCPYTDLSYIYYEDGEVSQQDYFVSVVDNIRNTRKTMTYDALGRLTCAEDDGGTVSYSYAYETAPTGNIRDKMTVTVGNAVTTVVSDLRGNRLSIQDPDAGTVTCVYNALNQLDSLTDANGNTASFTYDLAGRTLQTVWSDGTDTETVTCIYDNAPGKGVGKLASVRHDNVLECEYVYDNLGRLSNHKVYESGTPCEHQYSYDTLGRLQYLTYPDGFRISHTYNDYSELKIIRDASDNSLVYASETRNKFRQPLKCRYGNGTGIQYTYNAYGLLTGIKNGDVTYDGGGIVNGGTTSNGHDTSYEIGDQYRNLVYTYNDYGFIETKTDNRVNQSESYRYDELDRLVSCDVNNVTAATFTYYDNGNIHTNSRVGTYSYGTGRPHAVTSITSGIRPAIPSSQCDVTYNLRNRPATLSENGYNIALDYDASGMRRHTVVTNGQTLVKEKTRISNLYELETTPTVSRRLDYIYAEGRVVAVHVDENSTGSLYYVLTDHLGSWEKVLDGNKATVQQTHFDPWGNRMSYSAWNTSQTQIAFPFDRGFTGHEHYDCMHIINANARLYDPVVGRFFSPDPFVQAPDGTQGFNRYSYCLNNPVMYSDPTGEVFGIDDLIAAAALGAIINGFTQIVAGNVNNAGDFFLAAGIGALSGAAGLAIGSGVNAAIAGSSFASGFLGSATVSSTGFWAGAGTGAASGFASGFILGTGNSLLAGNSFGQSLQDGWTEGVMGLGSGTVIGGICGGIDAYLNNKNPWTGKPPYYEASLDNYSIVYQSDDMNCKNAVLESIERMNGGTRTQADFKELGDLYLKQYPKATLEQYFEYFGFTVKNPAGRKYTSIGNLMKAGCPTVIEENVAGGHTLTICRIRQWTKTGKINVWLADPARGIWKTRWKTIVNPEFNHGLYTFILSL